MQAHQVEHAELWVDAGKQRRQDGEVLGDVVGHREGGQRATGHQQLFADLHHVQQLGWVAVQVHQVGGLAGGLGAIVHGHADVGLGQRRGVVGTVATHGDHLAFGLFTADALQFALRRSLGNKVIDPGFGGNCSRSQRVIAGHHDGANTHRPQLGETLANAGFNHVLQVNGTEQLAVAGHQQRRAPALGDSLNVAGQGRRHLLAAQIEVIEHRIDRTLAVAMPLPVGPGQAGFGRERNHLDRLTGRLLHRVQAAQVLDNRLALGGVIGQRGQQRRLRQVAGGHARRLEHGAAAAVTEGDGAGLVQQQHVYVTGRLYCTARLGDHVQAHQAVHAGDADGRQQATNGGRNQRHQQRHQVHQRQIAAGITGERLQGGHHQQEDQRQADQQNIQCHLIGGFLPLGAFHQGDHPIQGRLAWIGGDLHQQPIRDHPGIAGYGRTVATGLTNHWRRLTGNRCLVDRRDTFDYLAVTGNLLAALNPHDVTTAQAAGGHRGVVPRTGLLARTQALAARLEAVGAGFTPAFGQGFGEVGKQHGEPQPQGDLQRQPRGHLWAGYKAQQRGDHSRQLHHQHHRGAHQLARIELDEGLFQRRLPQRRQAGLGLFALLLGAVRRLGLRIHSGFLIEPTCPDVRQSGPGPVPAGRSNHPPARWSTSAR